MSLCVHLADRIEAQGEPRPTIGKRWLDAARLMLDSDHRTKEQVHTAIDWAHDDSFWCSNIMSMPTLRKQYGRMRLQAQKRGHSASPSANGNSPAAPQTSPHQEHMRRR